MASLSVSVKKFMGNKNTVTIVLVVVCLLVLYFGYNYRINQAVKMVTVPYAIETIQPKTKITSDMIGLMEVPSTLAGNYYTSADQVKNLYSNYNTVIPAGSLFYEQSVVEEDKIPDSVFYDVEEGYVVDNFKVDMESTYGNSIMPDNLINVYVKYVNNNKIVYGKFIENISVLAVKDASGNNVFENSEEVRTPAYLFLSFPENKYLLFKMTQYVRDYFGDYGIEIVITPNTVEYEPEEEGAIKITSETITNFIMDKVEKIDTQDSEFNSLYDEIRNNG